MLRKLLLACALLFTAAAQATQPAVPMIDPPVVAVPQGLPVQEVQRAIIACALKEGWTVVQHPAGLVVLRYEHDYVLDVAVGYDAQAVNIAYRDSSKLSYGQAGGKAMIHPSYNRWVSTLAHDIGERLQYAAGE